MALPSGARKPPCHFLLTVVFRVAELLLLFRSCVVALTVAVSVSTVPEPAVTVTTRLTVAYPLSDAT